MSKQEEDARRRNFAEEFRRSATVAEPPGPEVLEASVEATAKCGKCGGGVRAVCAASEPASRADPFDLEVLVMLYCRDAACGWQANQWRPWTRRNPTEL